MFQSCHANTILVRNGTDCSQDNVSALSQWVATGNGDGAELVVKLYVISLLCVIGLLGNVLSVVVLRQDKERREALFLLQALALADGLYLLTALLRYPLKYLLPSPQAHEAMQPLVFPLIKTFQSICIWMVVLVTIDRFIYVCHPLRAQQLFHYRSRRIFAGLVFLFGFLYNLPRFFAYCLLTIKDVCSDVTVTRMTYKPVFSNTLYFDIYQYALYITLLYILPLAILIFMNFRLIQAIHYSRRRHSQMSIGSVISGAGAVGGENNATLVLVIIVVVFIVCETPELILKILTVIHRYFQNVSLYTDPSNRPINTISELLMVINSSVNFFIYVFFGKRFRVILKETFVSKFQTTTSLLTHETYPLQRQQLNHKQYP